LIRTLGEANIFATGAAAIESLRARSDAPLA
jgi:hypothetical protein